MTSLLEDLLIWLGLMEKPQPKPPSEAPQLSPEEIAPTETTSTKQWTQADVEACKKCWGVKIGSERWSECSRYDVNYDGSVNYLDAQIIAQNIKGA